MEESKQSIFKTLSQQDLTSKHKEKNKLTYLPWSSAWEAVKKIYPKATFTVIKDINGNRYHTDGRTCNVETSVTIEDETLNQSLAVMDYANKAIPLESIRLQENIY